MPIRDCTVLAVEGTHNAGKTTLALALTAYCQSQGIDTAYVPDAARDSPLISDVVVHGIGRFDVTAQIDLVTATVSSQIRAAHRRRLLVVDKTPANVLAYASILLPEDEHRLVRRATEALCHAWQPYGAVILCVDQYPLDLTADPYRVKVTALQSAAASAVAAELAAARYPVIALPTGLTTTQRVAWLAEHLDPPVPTPARIDRP